MPFAAILLILILLAGLSGIVGVIWTLLTTTKLPPSDLDHPDDAPPLASSELTGGKSGNCGKCGYSARGISTLNCPECGADLRAVGIVTGKSRRLAGSGCVFPIVFTIGLFILALILAPILEPLIPKHRTSNVAFGLTPNSSQFTQATFQIATSWVDTSRSGRNNGGVSTSLTYGFGTGTHSSNSSVRLDALKPPAQLDALRLEISPAAADTAWRDGWIEIDPQTLAFRGEDIQGRAVNSNTPLTAQGVLAFLGACGADTSLPEVQRESQELFVVIDGIRQGLHNFSLKEFRTRSSSSSYGYSSRIVELGLIYLLFWLALWIAGLVFWSRRRRRRQSIS